MKKDMAGAAIVLGLAQAIMDAGLPVRLRVLLPAVENAVSGNAMRPLDIVAHPQGADRRDRQHRRRGPAHPVRRAGRGLDREAGAARSTCATLTGAARVALGPELPALFCNDDALADALLAAGAGRGRPDVADAALEALPQA